MAATYDDVIDTEWTYNSKNCVVRLDNEGKRRFYFEVGSNHPFYQDTDISGTIRVHPLKDVRICYSAENTDNFPRTTDNKWYIGVKLYRASECPDFDAIDNTSMTYRFGADADERATLKEMHQSMGGNVYSTDEVKSKCEAVIDKLNEIYGL